MDNLAIIDGKSIFYRAYYAMGNLALADGTPTGAVYGFASMLIEIIEKLEPEYIAVAWDKSKTNISKRRDIYADYKANRKPAPDDFKAQIPLLRQLLEAWHIPLYEFDGYEADDIIGTLARQSASPKLQVNIISGDLDMLQIVADHITVHHLRRGFSDVTQFNIAAVETKYQLKKEQFLDLKALKGDSSDNIPGVPGIGEKGAIKLLNHYGNLDNIYANIDEITPNNTKQKLIAGKDSAYMSRALAKIMFDAPITFDAKATDWRKYQGDKLYQVLSDLRFQSLIKKIQNIKFFPPLIALELAPPAQTMQNPSTSKDIKVPASLYLSYDVKADMHASPKLAQEILDGRPFWDLGQAAFILSPLESKQLQPSLLEKPARAQLEAQYLAQKQQVQSQPGLRNILENFDLPLIPILFQMEKHGIKINPQHFDQLSQRYQQEVKTLSQEIYAIAGTKFNLNSPSQLSDVLFNKLLLPTAGIKKTKRAYSTGAKELAKLKAHSPIIAKIERLREITKLLNTYIEPLTRLADSNQRIHTTFTQNVTATGRLSSLNPNLQNIPTRNAEAKAIRSGFIADTAKVFVAADYAQFELRLAAALSGDQDLIDAFNQDVDIHRQTASESFHVPLDQVSAEQRRAAKVINFGVLYGMSVHGLSEATGMPYYEAKNFITSYEKSRFKMRAYLNHLVTDARSKGYVESKFGRRRPTPDLNSPNFMIRGAAERAAQNMPIQGTEADLMKLAMIKIAKALPKDAHLILQVHDSLMIECPEAKAQKLAKMLKDNMENIAPDLGVKLSVDIKIGKNWGEI